MTNDLISREAAVKLLCDKADGYHVSMFATSDECHVARIVALEAANEIESIPAVGAAPVVHCCECKRFDTGYCYHWEAGTSCEDFCSRGAKMDE